MSSTKHCTPGFVGALPCINPNVPLHATEIPIPPGALVAGGIPSQIHVFPGHLDEQRLRKAIQVLSSIVPTICSRFRVSPDGRFYFALTQSPIVFDTQFSDLDDLFVDTQERVVQDYDTIDFLTQPDAVKAIIPNRDGPLACFRLTTFASGKSCLGAAFAHIIADAFSHTYILDMLSKIYTHGEDWRPEIWPTYNNGLGEALDGLPLPSFEDCPSIFRSSLFSEQVSLEETEADALKKGFGQPMKLVSVLLDKKQLTILKEKCLAELDPRPNFLSSFDVICGWLASISARGMDEPLTNASYTFNLRSVGLCLPNFLGDAVMPLEIDTTGPKEPVMQYIAKIAGRCREMIDRVKTDPGMTKDWVHHFALAQYTGQLEGKQINYSFNENTVLFNSYTPFEYAVSFGFPADQCQTYMGGTFLRIPRVFMANRLPGQREEDRRLELAFVLPEGKYDQMMKVIEKDQASWRV